MLFVVIAVVAACAAAMHWRVGYIISLVSLLLFCAFSTGAVSDWLMGMLDAQIPREHSDESAGAIVVFGADLAPDEDGQGRDALGYLSLERELMAAREYRARQLPILVSGGPMRAGDKAFADLMAAVLENDLHVPVRWRETRSQTTFENAKFSAAVLQANGISAVILIAQRWDMPRAIWSFKKFGIIALPSLQVSHSMSDSPALADFVPSLTHAVRSFIALHELIGLYYYRYRD